MQLWCSTSLHESGDGDNGDGGDGDSGDGDGDNGDGDDGDNNGDGDGDGILQYNMTKMSLVPSSVYNYPSPYLILSHSIYYFSLR